MFRSWEICWIVFAKESCVDFVRELLSLWFLRRREREEEREKKKIINQVIILIDNNIWSCYNKCYNTLFFKRATVKRLLEGVFFVCFLFKKALASLLEMLLLVTKSGRVQNKFKVIIFSHWILNWSLLFPNKLKIIIFNL